MNCEICGTSLLELTSELGSAMFILSGTNRVFCRSCYWNELCKFCKPPKKHSECQGHTTTARSGNRFLEDKQFVQGTNFDLE